MCLPERAARPVLFVPLSYAGEPLGIQDVERYIGNHSIEYSQIRAVVATGGGSAQQASIAPYQARPAQPQTELAGWLTELQQSIASLGADSQPKGLLGSLTQSLSVKVCLESRRHGGYQYSSRQMVNTVLLSDELKDLAQIKNVVCQCFNLSLQPALADHLLQQEPAVES